MILEVHISKISVRSKSIRLKKRRCFFISVLLHLELTDSDPTFASNFPGSGCGGVPLPRAGSLSRSAPPADGGSRTFFKSALREEKTEIGRLWEASPRHCHAQPAQLSDHNTVRPPRGAAPVLLEVPRHRFLRGTGFEKEELAWGANWPR